MPGMARATVANVPLYAPTWVCAYLTSRAVAWPGLARLGDVLPPQQVSTCHSAAAQQGGRYLVAALYFFCSYWMDKYNLLRLFATRSASDCAVGAGIVRTYRRQSIHSSQSLWLRCDHSVRHSTIADSEAVAHRACLFATAVACFTLRKHLPCCLAYYVRADGVAAVANPLAHCVSTATAPQEPPQYCHTHVITASIPSLFGGLALALMRWRC